MSETIKYRTCHLCEAMCGLEIEVKNNEVIAIKGHKEDVYSRGHICPKGVALKDLHNDPNRLKRPVKKTAEGWQTISWEEAFDIAEQSFKKIRKKYGNDAIGTYTGNPTVHNTGTAITLYDTINALNTRNRFASHSLDSVPVFLVNQMMFGHAMMAPIPDIDHLDYLLIIGANPMASNGSFMSTPNIREKIKAIQEKGGKVVVIDPRKTETADKASAHYFIHPEKDVLLLLSIINELVLRNAIPNSKALSLADHLDELKEMVQPYTKEVVAPMTGMSTEQIKNVVDDLIKYPHSVVYGRLGVNTQSYGTLCQWLITSINILLGQLDIKGGLQFTLPAIDYVTLMAHESKMFRYSSRVKSYKEIVGEFPTATLADEILTKGKNQIRGFISIAGNPARSAPNSQLVEKALADLEFMLAIDMYVNETTQYADLIMPPGVGLETMHYSFVLHMIATRNTTKFSPAPLPISKDQRYDWQIMGELQRRLFTGNLFQRIKSNIMSRIHPKTKLDLALKTGPYGVWGGRFLRKDGLSLKRLEKHPGGIELSELSSVLPKRLFTKNKRIELMPEIFVKEMEKVKELLIPEKVEQYPLKLIGRRHLRSNNSWMHNLPVLEGGSRTCTMMIHPDDATTHGIQPEEVVEVYSEFGSISIEAEVTTNIMQGTISIPHGWGHDSEGVQMQTAKRNAGANINQLMDHDRLDPLSYNMAFNGHPVAVRKIESV
ncbi:molybdopterin-dependent oxidoreductase [Aquimarina sp. MMG016]|uniref:molybdopterin-dependent oxidoreductase n=1 Tax=Aquimarina sp. MMG016 TaxID=2822690 RepID=UPI001B3A2561|nr:molybdopterin-dependent oxidoreductase [Aquimarina sp. MMG016]MBQ4821846.1 molybdopterin-dependent oxidoreductase [Aquimarina sp. MMG016]